MDSANILSVLASLAPPPGADAPDVQLPGVAQPQTNVMQAAAAPPTPSFQDPTAQVAQAATAASPPMPKPRRSLIDTIGRISDVLARVGGAQALYQPTLDADTARQTAAADHDLATQKANVDLATSKFDLSDKQREAGNDVRSRFASVLGAVNDSEDAANLPAMMKAAGLTDPRYDSYIRMVQANPDTAKTLASALGGDGGDETGKTIKTGYDAKGNRVAYVVDGDGNPHILSGVTPDANYKVVNTGDKTSLVGPNGLPSTVIPNKISPNTAATVAQSNTNNLRTTSTQKEIAGMPARPKAPAAGTANGFTAYNEARSSLTDLSHQIDTLINDPSLSHATGLTGSIERHIPGTPAQRILGNITTLKGQALSAAVQHLKALSAGGNLGFRLTQQEANAFAAQMAGALENTSQSSTDYASNLRSAQGRINAMITRMDQDAVRNKYASAPGVPFQGSTTSQPTGANPAAIAEARRRGLIH